jgi:hypothetical protein
MSKQIYPASITGQGADLAAPQRRTDGSARPSILTRALDE